MAIAVVRQGFAPRVGSSLDLELVVVPSRWQPVHNGPPVRNVMGSFHEPERGDRAMSVHGDVVGTVESRFEECRRLFDRLAGSY